MRQARRDRTTAGGTTRRGGRVRPAATRRAIVRGGLAALLLLGLGLPAAAQHAGEVGSAPPPPAGPGSLTVQLVAEDAPAAGAGDPAALEGLSIALYALAPDGTPGFAGGETDAAGRHVFEGLSTDPGIVYLVGARYADIPFGERVTFVEGETSARVEIRVSQPTDRVEGVRVTELRTRVDWLGDRIVVTEIQTIENDSGRVIRLPEADSGRAITLRPLPADARDFAPGPGSIGDGLAVVDDRVRFWGPLYPGEQRVEYRFTLPLPASDARRLSLPIALREPIGQVVVIAGTQGVEAEGAGLVASQPVRSEGEPARASWARDGLPGGTPLEVSLALPEARLDPGLVSLPRADVWLDLDDTRLEANVDLQLSVEPGPPVAGTPSAPLLHVTLPAGATLNGVSPEAEPLGLLPTADGGFDVLGPVPPGEHSLAYSYRLPSRPDGLRLGMRFPLEVQTLNVLIADTGLALESSRLHRRRPFRNRTRNYLHREAFNVAPDEVVDLTLEPLGATGLPQQASLALTVAAAAGAALFLMAPLRGARRREVETDPERARIREEREAVYAEIADLDHDFETGKLAAEDHAEMREALVARAVVLLREERAAIAAASARGDDVSHPPTPVARLDEDAGEHAPPATGRFCPGCGQRVDPLWRFCSHCGGTLHPVVAGDGAARDAARDPGTVPPDERDA